MQDLDRCVEVVLWKLVVRVDEGVQWCAVWKQFLALYIPLMFECLFHYGNDIAALTVRSVGGHTIIQGYPKRIVIMSFWTD